VVPWKYAFKRNLDSYKSSKRKERKEEHWCQMMEQRHKEQEEKM
jgi:hypothetical protein